MGRAIVREPQVFLMDEPLSNLDAKLRVQMRAEISRIQRQLSVTTVYVTHDQVEAMTMGDRVAVLRRGLLQQFEEPQRLYEQPANLFVASFIGSPAMNMLEATLEREGDDVVCRVGSATLPLPAQVLSARPALVGYAGKSIALGIRPEALRRFRSPQRRRRHPARRRHARSRRSVRSSSRMSRWRRSPCSSTTCVEGLVDMEEADDLVELRADTGRRPPGDARRPPRRVGERAARRDRRARGRPPEAALLRPRKRCDDRCLSARSGSATAAPAASTDTAVTVLDGSTFVVCDRRGDLDGIAATSGFFAADTRFLSRSVLTIDGERAESVSLEQAAPHLASFELRGPRGLALRRELFVGRGLEETITVENRSDESVEALLALEFASDFADIFAVKRVEDLGAPGSSEVAPSRPERWEDAATLEFADEGFPARTLVHLAPAPDERGGGAARYRLRLEPGARWRLLVAVEVAPERGDVARRPGIRAAAARRPARARCVSRRVVELGAAAPGGRARRSSARGAARSPTLPPCGCAGRRRGWSPPPACRGS